MTKSIPSLCICYGEYWDFQGAYFYQKLPSSPRKSRRASIFQRCSYVVTGNCPELWKSGDLQREAQHVDEWGKHDEQYASDEVKVGCCCCVRKLKVQHGALHISFHFHCSPPCIAFSYFINVFNLKTDIELQEACTAQLRIGLCLKIPTSPYKFVCNFSFLSGAFFTFGECFRWSLHFIC